MKRWKSAWRMALIVACGVTSPGMAASAAAPSALASLNRFVESEMAQQKIPGLALAVVRDGHVVHMHGYGLRDLERKLPVTPQTVFAIGSVTKSFTVLTLGAQVQRGTLDWDAPVKTYLSDFQLVDPYATEKITARDLVTHRSGLPRHDRLWQRSGLDRQQLFQRLRYLQPNTELRTRFQYNNLMFVAAGHLAERVAGMPWEQLVEQEILRPLGMRNSSTGVAGFTTVAEPALPYQSNAEGALERVDYANIDAIGPAGSINSSVEDMSIYLRALMDDGRWQGRQLLDAATVRDMQAPQTIMPDAPLYAELGRNQYGMGVLLSTYRTHPFVGHGGSIDGFTSFLFWLPDQRIGVVVLANTRGTRICSVVGWRVADLLLGLKPLNWSARYAAEAQKAASHAVTEAASNAPQKKGTSPAHPLADYVGEYDHPAYGTVQVAQAGEPLVLIYHGTRRPLRHVQYEFFEASADVLHELEVERVGFKTGVDGEVQSLSMTLEPDVDDIVFARRAHAPIGAREAHQGP